MATIKTDPQTTKNIIKDITTTQLCSYQLGHKYKLGKITIDRIGREQLGTDIYSRSESLACLPPIRRAVNDKTWAPPETAPRALNFIIP